MATRYKNSPAQGEEGGPATPERRLAPGAGARGEFPIFSAHPGLCYLDSAASSQKPRSVIERMDRYYRAEHANIHRGAYALSAAATVHYEEVRGKVAAFLNAAEPAEIVFTRGATESINLVARCFDPLIGQGDTILLTVLEHHSNIVPWQLLAARRGARVVFADVTADGALNLQDFSSKLTECRPRIVGLTGLSNALGTVVPVAELVAAAHRVGARVLVDGAQAVLHGITDVRALDADFYVFSGHKIYGPTGVGVLYGKREMLDRFEPFLGGGDMIRTVSIEGSTWADTPQKFEAGTPPIAEVIGLGEAIDFMNAVGLGAVAAYEDALFEEAWETIRAEPGVTVYGPKRVGGAQRSIISFNVGGVHAHDLSTIADSFKVQIRGGHHCAMPLLKRLGLPATARASLGLYTVRADFDPLLEAIRRARKLFG